MTLSSQEVGSGGKPEEDGMRAKRISLTVALLTILATAPVLADQTAGHEDPAAPDPDRAAQLRQQAEELFSQPKQWKKAVRLLEESASLREASDPEAYECLIYAGRIRAAMGDPSGARESLEKAGEHAMARGALVEAANAFIDAAHAAVALKDARGAQDLVDRARLLADSPLLSLEQRSGLKARLAA
jgi:tetratricopeptide (TPR) repeat protein